MIEIHLRGRAADHPASVVLPLLISDLPAFCRWRGEPAFGSTALAELTSVCDRFVVDSNEWNEPSRGVREAGRAVPRALSSPISPGGERFPGAPASPSSWPGVKRLERLRVEGPKADALLLAGWLRSRLRREIDAHPPAGRRAIEAIWLDGDPVALPFTDRPTGSALLSAELDNLARDPIYEAAVGTLCASANGPGRTGHALGQNAA